MVNKFTNISQDIVPEVLIRFFSSFFAISLQIKAKFI